ncbi:RB1-inducible coiled-coil protein 1-like isoform X2 [Argiope bruennichi]|uniref:RB1-inducible coiled-coil protein 1-like isoform X2 n=1 Tax=Argiope bruennichi TaxID=94029 RepID=UPI0024957B47|nr:RB1-inducible coiled-coil protein 1-like isoform X2 [Argiope bruennichi]
MSLYVFIVSSGTTLKFDVEFAVKKVLELKNAITERKGIPVQDQVLLCSGGEELKCDSTVGNYSGAGTDTNPIFLFQKGLFDPNNSHFDHMQQNVPIMTSLDLSIENDVKGCANMIPSIQVLTVKASLAQRFADYALKGKEECIALVRDQHLQQQGWAAVIANLDDIKDSLQKNFHHLCDLFGNFLENVPRFQEILKLALEDIALLAKVPVLPKLIGDIDESTEQDLETKHTLLTWFCTEPQYYIVSVAEKCQAGIAALNEECLMYLKKEFLNVLKDADNPEIKEVKGIGDRLASLNKLIEDFDKICNDQNEMKTVFSPDKVMHARDPNLLPDLCMTFQRQLELMLGHHKELIEILEKCVKAKRELSDNINHRIQYISFIESNISRMQTKIHNFRKYMQSVMNQIDCLHQVHLAPQRYLKMCSEVCRRREFSARYMKWATELSSQCAKLYETEVSLRKNISKEVKNMVDGLFPGMNDMPPPFAIECPQPFDQHLPEVTREDLDWLKTCVPELAHLCEVLPPEPLPCISQAESDSAFSSNIPSSLKISSLENSHSNILKVHAKISALQKFIQELRKNLQHDLSNLKATVKDDLCEGMSQASQIVENINSYMQRLNQQMLLEKEEALDEAKKEFSSIENAYIHRLEVESQKLNDAENQIVHYEERLREALSSIEDLKHEKEQLYCDLQKQKELTKGYLLEHELELDLLKNQMKEKIEEQEIKIIELNQALSNALSEITNLKEEKSKIEEDYNEKLQKEQSILSEMQEKQNHLNQELIRLQETKDVTNNISDLEMELKLINNEKIQCLKDLEDTRQNYDKLKAEIEVCKETALKKLEEKLCLRHKTEMDAIRCRYRFTLEALPFASDAESLDLEMHTLLEGIKKEIIENSDSWSDDLQAFAEKYKKELDDMIEEVLKRQKERDKLILTLQSDHEEALEKLKSRITAENQVSFNEAINRLAKDKDAKIDDLQSRISVLEAKLFAIKSHLSQYPSPTEGLITTSDSSMSQSDSGASCSSKIFLSADESRLLTKLQKELEPVLESVPLLSQSTHSSVVQSESLKKTPSQPPCFDCNNKISILTCNEGDLVLLCYEERHENFAVFHFGPFVHFLHSDSLQALNLKLPAGPNERWALGVVVKKEFCVTKKQENRYKVSCGTKFYRVKVKPWDRETALALHQLQRSTHMTSTVCSSKPSISQSSSKDADGGKGGGSGSMSASAI